jgi:Cft2 family RNA processing exonuclease
MPISITAATCPTWLRKATGGPIYTTDATAHLANIMLIDSGHIHESDAEYLNRKRKVRGEKKEFSKTSHILKRCTKFKKYFS